MRRAHYDLTRCHRCGRERETHPSRPTPPLCVDCKTVERLIDDGEPFTGLTYRDRRGIVHMQPPVPPMSRADRAWCEKAAGQHFWHTWERHNRRGENPLQDEAELRAKRMPAPNADTTTKKGMAA